jgi:hypothetical protein
MRWVPRRGTGTHGRLASMQKSRALAPPLPNTSDG